MWLYDHLPGAPGDNACFSAVKTAITAPSVEMQRRTSSLICVRRSERQDQVKDKPGRA